MSEFTCQSVGSFDPDQSLLRQDIILQGSAVTIEIKASKTDPFRQGVTIILAETGTSTCPVKALSKYLAMTSKRAAHLPVFQYSSGSFLTRQTLSRTIQDFLSSDRYSSHSFRIGTATSAVAAGVSDWLIQVLGRWSSQCFQSYICTPHSTICSAMKAMANVHLPSVGH